jgi:hypothetical protein
MSVCLLSKKAARFFAVSLCIALFCIEFGPLVVFIKAAQTQNQQMSFLFNKNPQSEPQETLELER